MIETHEAVTDEWLIVFILLSILVIFVSNYKLLCNFGKLLTLKIIPFQ